MTAFTIRPYTKLPRAGISQRVQPSKGVELPMRGGEGGQQLNLTPPGFDEMEKIIGHERARDVQKLKDKGVVGTLPELCTYEWLESHGYAFQFQSSQMGGRHYHGGAVIDFLIGDLSRMGWYVWRVQGEYWHLGMEVGAKDDSQKARLRRTLIDGIPVVEVVDIWEDDIYQAYPRVFEMAEAGIGLRA